MNKELTTTDRVKDLKVKEKRQERKRRPNTSIKGSENRATRRAASRHTKLRCTKKIKKIRKKIFYGGENITPYIKLGLGLHPHMLYIAAMNSVSPSEVYKFVTKKK